MEAAAVEKSILIRVCRTRYADVGVDDNGEGMDLEELVCRETNLPDPNLVDYNGECGYNLEELASRKPNLPDPDLVHTWSENAWFIIEPGVKISEVGSHTPPQDQTHRLVKVAVPPALASALVGSRLYEIGDNFSEVLKYETFRGFRCFEIKSLRSGRWKFCDVVDFEFQGDRAAAVFNEYIYLFGVSSSPFACVYNTITEKSYIVGRPPLPPSKDPIAEVWAPLEGEGMLVSFPHLDNGNFYLHDPATNSWTFCKNHQPLPAALAIVPANPPIRPGPSSVLNDILYILDLSRSLHAYDCKNGKLLYTVKLPNLYSESGAPHSRTYYPSHMVAVSDSVLHVIGECISSIFCARVSIPSATLLGVRCFERGKILSVLNCVPLDASLAPIAKNPPDATPGDLMILDETSEEDTLSGNDGNEEDIEREEAAAEAFRQENESIFWNPVATLDASPNDSMLLDETREDDAWEDDAGEDDAGEDDAGTARRLGRSKKPLLPMFPISKRLLHQARTKKSKGG